jgi:hypothetical protein
LLVASASGHLKVVELLVHLSHGTSVDVCNDKQRTHYTYSRGTCRFCGSDNLYPHLYPLVPVPVTHAGFDNPCHSLSIIRVSVPDSYHIIRNKIAKLMKIVVEIDKIRS